MCYFIYSNLIHCSSKENKGQKDEAACPSLQNELVAIRIWTLIWLQTLCLVSYLHSIMSTFVDFQPIEREGTYKTFSPASICCLSPPVIANSPEPWNLPKAAPHIAGKPHYSIWGTLEVKSNDPSALPFVASKHLVGFKCPFPDWASPAPSKCSSKPPSSAPPFVPGASPECVWWLSPWLDLESPRRYTSKLACENVFRKV